MRSLRSSRLEVPEPYRGGQVGIEWDWEGKEAITDGEGQWEYTERWRNRAGRNSDRGKQQQKETEKIETDRDTDRKSKERQRQRELKRHR